MRKIIFLVCVLLAPIGLFGAQKKSESPTVSATAEYVIDGDTFAAIVLLENEVRVSVRVRIRNIDAPEIHGECESEISVAQRARTRLRELLPRGAEIKLSEIKDDKYLGRIDAIVKTQDNVDVGAVLLKENLVRAYNGGKRLGWCGSV